MPLPGNNYKIFFFIFILIFFTGINSFAQDKKFAAREDKLVNLYSKLTSFTHVSYDSIELYSEKFEKGLISFIQNNPATLKYPFKSFLDSGVCQVKTTRDGNFRIYSWDTWTGGTMHYFKEIYQWKANGKVFIKVPQYEEGDPGADCSALYTVFINNRSYYLAVKNGIGSTRYGMQSISAYSIDGTKLNDSVKLFKTRTEKLNTIDIGFEFRSIYVNDGSKELITYDDKLNIVYIPLVDEDDLVTEKNLLYQLKGRYFEYIGVETGRRKSK